VSDEREKSPPSLEDLAQGAPADGTSCAAEGQPPDQEAPQEEARPTAEYRGIRGTADDIAEPPRPVDEMAPTGLHPATKRCLAQRLLRHSR